MNYLFFILILGGGEAPSMVSATAESCQQALDVVEDSLPDGYFPLGECLGRTDLELEVLEQTTSSI